MTEPSAPGFTGVVWEAREPDRLARELAAGPGALSMAEAGAAWARLAASFGAGAVEFDGILRSLRGAWQSRTSGPVLETVARLRDWLGRAASAAADNAIRAQAQALAYEAARRAMPDAGELAALQAMQRAVEQAGAALGAPLRAAAARLDDDSDLARATAARVMRAYESATEPLAAPWQQDRAPTVATSEALHTERAVARARQSAPAAETQGVWMAGPSAVSPTLTAYRVSAYEAAAIAEMTETVVPQHIDEPLRIQAPMAAPVVPATGAAQAQDSPARAGYTGASPLGPDLGIVAGPAVLGAADSRPAAVQAGAAP